MITWFVKKVFSVFAYTGYKCVKMLLELYMYYRPIDTIKDKNVVNFNGKTFRNVLYEGVYNMIVIDNDLIDVDKFVKGKERVCNACIVTKNGDMNDITNKFQMFGLYFDGQCENLLYSDIFGYMSEVFGIEISNTDILSMYFYDEEDDDFVCNELYIEDIWDSKFSA